MQMTLAINMFDALPSSINMLFVDVQIQVSLHLKFIKLIELKRAGQDCPRRDRLEAGSSRYFLGVGCLKCVHPRKTDFPKVCFLKTISLKACSLEWCFLIADVFS